MKGVWVTALGRHEERVKETLSMLKKYALDANGHFWEGDLEKMAWSGPKEQLVNEDTVQLPAFQQGLLEVPEEKRVQASNEIEPVDNGLGGIDDGG